MPTRKTPSPDLDQHARFVKLARELGCDEDEAAFERAVRTVAGAGPAGGKGRGGTGKAPAEGVEPSQQGTDEGQA